MKNSMKVGLMGLMMAAMFFATTNVASAHTMPGDGCAVNAGDCSYGGRCTINVAASCTNGDCGVNAAGADCAKGGDCLLNVGICYDGGQCPVNDGNCHN
jgi:hypothetical protein